MPDHKTLKMDDLLTEIFEAKAQIQITTEKPSRGTTDEEALLAKKLEEQGHKDPEIIAHIRCMLG